MKSSFECMVILKSRGQGPKRWRSTEKICPVLSTRIWTLSPGLENNHTLKSWSGIFPTILTSMIMLENCQNNISVYGCSPIQGTKFYSCWNLMKPGSQSGTYANCIMGSKATAIWWMFRFFLLVRLRCALWQLILNYIHYSVGTLEPP